MTLLSNKLSTCWTFPTGLETCSEIPETQMCCIKDLKPAQSVSHSVLFTFNKLNRAEEQTESYCGHLARCDEDSFLEVRRSEPEGPFHEFKPDSSDIPTHS